MKQIMEWRNSVPELEKIDCDLMLSHLFKCDRSFILAHPEKKIDESDLVTLNTWKDRLVSGEPIAYILGDKEFWSLSFHVNPSVLIPRPETELLVELVSNMMQEGMQILDLGTGCGAIAIALDIEAQSTGKTVEITASDISLSALKVCEKNIIKHSSKIKLIKSNWFLDIHGTFDLIIINPPYISKYDPNLKHLKAEPKIALESGDQGLDAIRNIVEQAPKYLKYNGCLLLEHGYNQGDNVKAILRDSGFTNILTKQDLSGIDRVTIASKKY